MKINIDKTIIKVLFLILGIKFFFSYLNVELDWWQRHLTPNIEKFNFFNLSIGQLVHFPAQHLGINGRVKGHKRGPEAGGERRDGLIHPGFRPCHLGRVSGYEMICGLAGGKPGNGRQDPKGIGG